MALRFGKRITLIPGVRLNIGKKGVSLSAGPRGASLNFGKKSTHVNLGIPGTGLSTRQRPSSYNSSSRSQEQLLTKSANGIQENIEIRLKVDDFGILSFETKDGLPLPNKLINKIKKERPELIEQVLQQAAKTVNKDINELLHIHHSTPNPYQFKLLYPRFDPPHPKKPILREVTFFHRLLRLAHGIEAENNKKLGLYNEAVSYWENVKKELDEARNHFYLTVKQAESGNLQAIEQVLSYVLSDLLWAKDTQVSFEFKDNFTLFLDGDLPDIAHMPKKTAEIASRGAKLIIRERTEKQLKKDFCYLIHAICFRICGQVFAALPILRRIILSGYVQRNNLATGVTEDIYIISVDIEQRKWLELDFKQLNTIDPTFALERFNLRRDLDKSGNLGTIEPFYQK